MCYNIVMKITRLTLRNWRNISYESIQLHDGLNVLVGSNAQGKTNIVESIYMCCLGKSPRTDKDKELVKLGTQVAHIKTNYTCRYGDGEIAIGITGNKKSVTVNSVPLTKLGDLLGYLNCIYFSPNEIKIISSSPQERRKFMDIDLCQIDKAYYSNLAKFNRALAQRNNILKKYTSAGKIRQEIFIWDSILADTGARIIWRRKQFCEQLAPLASQCHSSITDNKEKLTLSYHTTIGGNSVSAIADNYLQALNDSIDKDIQLHYTTVGCQRDDIILAINNQDIRTYGSQGQLRTSALSLKLAELEIFYQLIGEYPILLLDDVLSELDNDRQQRLLSWADKTQVLLTTATEIPPQLMPTNTCTLHVSSGKVSNKKH